MLISAHLFDGTEKKAAGVETMKVYAILKYTPECQRQTVSNHRTAFDDLVLC